MRKCRFASVPDSCKSQALVFQVPRGLKKGVQDSRIRPVAMPIPAGVSSEEVPFEPPPRKEIPLAWAAPGVAADPAAEEACKSPQLSSGEGMPFEGSTTYKKCYISYGDDRQAATPVKSQQISNLPLQGSYRLKQNRGFETGYEVACKIEMNLQR
ncbi:UNVERIFIED_CONTAM: hypothetical protein FKN15_063598 [Acipenser sinensis]